MCVCVCVYSTKNPNLILRGFWSKSTNLYSNWYGWVLNILPSNNMNFKSYSIEFFPSFFLPPFISLPFLSKFTSPLFNLQCLSVSLTYESNYLKHYEWIIKHLFFIWFLKNVFWNGFGMSVHKGLFNLDKTSMGFINKLYNPTS